MIRRLRTLIRRHYRGIPDHALHGSASEPAEPVVASMPVQRRVSLFAISEAERFALVRAKVAAEMGIQPAPDVVRLITAMHARAVRMELDLHADDFAAWEAER